MNQEEEILEERKRELAQEYEDGEKDTLNEQVKAILKPLNHYANSFLKEKTDAVLKVINALDIALDEQKEKIATIINKVYEAGINDAELEPEAIQERLYDESRD